MARADRVDVCEALDKRAWRRLANRQVLDVTMRVSVSHRVGRTALARKFGLPAGAAATVTDGAASRALLRAKVQSGTAHLVLRLRDIAYDRALATGAA